MKLGNQELELLRYVDEHQPVTSREVADGFGAGSGLARTTVLTMMERLRQKGLLQRKSTPNGYVYTASEQTENVMQNLVQQFVSKTLGGSLSPISAFLANSDGFTPEELAELRQALDEIERKQQDA